MTSGDFKILTLLRPTSNPTSLPWVSFQPSPSSFPHRHLHLLLLLLSWGGIQIFTLAFSSLAIPLLLNLKTPIKNLPPPQTLTPIRHSVRTANCRLFPAGHKSLQPLLNISPPTQRPASPALQPPYTVRPLSLSLCLHRTLSIVAISQPPVATLPVYCPSSHHSISSPLLIKFFSQGLQFSSLQCQKRVLRRKLLECHKIMLWKKKNPLQRRKRLLVRLIKYLPEKRGRNLNQKSPKSQMKRQPEILGR